MEQFELHKEYEINKLLLEKEEDYEDETDEKYALLVVSNQFQSLYVSAQYL